MFFSVYYALLILIIIAYTYFLAKIYQGNESVPGYHLMKNHVKYRMTYPGAVTKTYGFNFK